MRRLLMAVGVAALLATPSAFAQTTISPQELEKAAFLSLQQGDPQRALSFAEALLTRDAKDVTAHLLRARALRDLGRFPEAQEAARAAWKLSAGEEEQFSSALIMAQVLSSADKKTRAQFWLRRAVQHAPSPALAARAKRDFKYVQQQNPWQTQLSFTLAPNSNINNGSIRETLGITFLTPFGPTDELTLYGSARALSGLEYGASVQSRYRFSQTERTAHDLVMSAAYRTYVLSGSARDILREARDEGGGTAPLETGSDFAFGSASIGYRFNNINLKGRGELSAMTTLSQSWYGGNPYASTLRGRLQQTFKPTPDRKLAFGLETEFLNGQATADSEKLEIYGSLEKQFQSGNGMYLSLSLAAQQSDAAVAEYTEVDARSVFSLGKPVMGAALQVGLGASYRDYDVSNLTFDGRQDLTVSADVTAVFRQIDYYGFNPSVTLSASSTSSNINLYDSNRVGLSIGIRSAF